jgi:D-alanyl-D-alanine carboxypeptidase (penicillin-binding protein 5/6)
MFEILVSVIISLSSIPNNTATISDTIQPTNSKLEKQYIKLNSTTPIISAEAGLVADLNTDYIFHQKNPIQRLPIASLTKIMTALIIIEENQLNEIATVPSQATTSGGSSMYLQTKEQISVENLLYGLLIQSGNDAAITLAHHNAETTAKFVDKMNQKAKELNLQNTSFANPMGFDDPENYSTIQDLYIIAKELYADPKIKKIVTTKSITVTSKNKTISHKLDSTNELLNNYLKISGLKTGSTELAGGCFIGITNEENPKISIVLGSFDRFKDSKILLDWTKNNFKLN